MTVVTIKKGERMDFGLADLVDQEAKVGSEIG